jgi:hypothetical protein
VAIEGGDPGCVVRVVVGAVLVGGARGGRVVELDEGRAAGGIGVGGSQRSRKTSKAPLGASMTSGTSKTLTWLPLEMVENSCP